MAIVRLDKLQAKRYGNLESIVHTTDMTNGLFFHLGNLVTGQTELREVAVPATATLMDEVVLHASPEVMYDPRKSGLKDFVVEAGKAGRAYHLTVGDIFTLTDDLITGATVVGQFVIPQDGSAKLKASATDAGATRFVGKVIEKTTLGYNASAATAIQVVKA